jgi:hypothetical protein
MKMLISLSDSRGFRLVAMSILPVSESTIIYGTSDGGISVHKKHPKFNKMMKNAGLQLNMKPHTCGADRRHTKVLWSSADIEVNNFW